MKHPNLSKSPVVYTDAVDCRCNNLPYVILVAPFNAALEAAEQHISMFFNFPRYGVDLQLREVSLLCCNASLHVVNSVGEAS